MFSRTLSSPTMPSALRSSGQNARPSRTACAGCVKRTALALHLQRAGVGRVEPEHQPRELGAARAEQAGDADDLAVVQVQARADAGGACAPKSRSDSRGAEPSSAACVPGASASTLAADASATSRPTIAATSAGAGSCAGVHSPTKRPLRSTVMRSAIA